MRKVVIALFSLLFFAVNQAAAYNLNYFSNDDKIVSALKVLEKNGGDEVLDNLMENGVKVIFYDLSSMDYSYAKDYAISSVNRMGDRYILINSRYMNSPKEALACLIAHESFHKLKVATFTEEVRCTQKEAEYWHKLKGQVATNSVKNVYTDRLDRLENMYLTSDSTHNKIAESIQNSQFYRNQLAMK